MSQNDEPMEDKLLRCPFCGDKAITTEAFGRKAVACKSCPAMMRSSVIDEDGEAEVVRDWNTRTT